MEAVSLVICTRNRASKLGACLAAVERLVPPGPDWEVIVVDNGSTDGTVDVLERFAKRSGLPAIVVQEPRAGLGRARNAGLARAQGDIIAFTDDDCYVHEDWLRQIAAVFAREDIGYLGGRILLFDPTDAPVTVRTAEAAIRIPPKSFVLPGVILGANMAVRRDAALAIGGFDPMLGAGTRFPIEDVDFVGRASWAGWAGGYYPEPVVYHHHARKPGIDVLRVQRGYAYGRGAYFAKFILQRQSRALYFRNWYWALRAHLAGGAWAAVLREIAGALLYCLRVTASASHRASR